MTAKIPALSSCVGDGPNPCWYVPHIVITVKQNGTVLGSSEFVQTGANLRILNACDTITSPFLSDNVRITQMLANCYPLIAHADGKIVTGRNPAHPGETMVILATGSGDWNGPLGKAATAQTPAYDRTGFIVTFDFRPNVFGILDNTSNDVVGGGNAPDYAGPASGMAGIDQFNIRLPGTFPPETRNCQGLGDTNMGITISKGLATTARLCVVF